MGIVVGPEKKCKVAMSRKKVKAHKEGVVSPEWATPKR
jgi:hypothetical protein